MRIIAGKYKGRKLSAFQASHLRPTSDRVKETLFNIISSYVDQANVLDLFAGTGNISIEFASRGASSVTSVEKHKKSLQILKKNIDLVSCEDITIVAKDVFSFIKSSTKDYDIIFIDPPFTEKISHPVMEELSKSKVFTKESLIIIESSKYEPLELAYGDLKCYDQRSFGDKNLSFFRLEE